MNNLIFWLLAIPLIVLIWMSAGYLAYGIIMGVAI